MLKHFRDNVGVLSLTTNPTNGVMWAHYADQSKGVCVGIDLESGATKATERSRSKRWELFRSTPRKLIELKVSLQK
jgi:hypothetical protein